VPLEILNCLQNTPSLDMDGVPAPGTLARTPQITSCLSRLHAAAGRLTLTLLVLGILADHPHHAVALDDLAVFANLLYRSSYFHRSNSLTQFGGCRRKIHWQLALYVTAANIRFLLVTVDYSASGKIVGREFNRNPVARKNLDEVHTHPARYVCQNDMPLIELDLEAGIGEGFHHNAVHFNRFFLRH
jgi:hypothetical protein